MRAGEHRIGRWGVGPRIDLPCLLYSGSGIFLSLANPGWFRIASAPSWPAAACGTGLMIAGAALYVTSLLLLNRNMKRGKLATNGPYRFVRHPLYASWILCIVPGVALIFESWFILTVSVVAYAFFRVFIHEEEDALESMFGEAYERYRSSTPALFPAWRTFNTRS
jgi:protein-S-isoprenylcysteine O-methyltransferase Ste14